MSQPKGFRTSAKNKIYQSQRKFPSLRMAAVSMILLGIAFCLLPSDLSAGPLYVVLSAGSEFDPLGGTGGAGVPWPSQNFSVGDPLIQGVSFTSEIGPNGGTATFRLVNTLPVSENVYGGLDIYLQAPTGTPVDLPWTCTSTVSETITQLGYYSAIAGANNCAGNVGGQIYSYTGTHSFEQTLSAGGTISRLTGHTISNPDFPGVTYSYVTTLGIGNLLAIGGDVGGSLNNGLSYAGNQSVVVNLSFGANVVPEPGTFVLMAAALAASPLRRLKRRP